MKTRRCFFCCGALFGAMSALLPRAARAEGVPESRLGQRGHVSLAAERVFGFTHASSSQSDTTYDTVSLLGASGYEVAYAPYSIPRLAVDGFVTDGFSIGTGINFANLSRSASSRSVQILGLYPRLGYAINISPAVTFWPRAGISYVLMDSGNSEHMMAATLEAQFVFSASHFGFMIGPTADVGVSATQNQKVTQLGAQAGLIGWF